MSVTDQSGSQSAATPPISSPRRNFRIIVGAMFFIQIVGGFTSGFWSPLVPAWSDAMHIGVGQYSWLSSISFLALVVAVPVLSALGDRHGHRKLLSVAIWTTAAAIALLVVAPSFGVALVGMCLWGAQGIWMAMLIALIRDTESGERANRGIAMLATGVTTGQLIGSVIAGPCLSLIGSVRVTVAILAVACVAAGVVAMALLPESATRRARSIDWIGVLGLSVGLVSLLLGVMNANKAGWTSVSTLTGVTCGLVVLAAWVAWERHTPAPLVNLAVLSSKAMWPAMVAAVTFGLMVWIPKTPLVFFLAAKPQSVGYGLGFTATAISVVLICFYLAQISGSSLCALLTSKIGPRGVIFAGIGCGTTGTAGMALLAYSSSMAGAAWLITVSFMVLGLGCGLLLGSMYAYVSEAAPADQVGVISGTYNTVRGVGGTVGGAAAAALLSAFTPEHSTASTVTGYAVVWFACAAAGVVTLLLMFAAWSRRGVHVAFPAAVVSEEV
ncbi:MFS transporter [Nocardia sp. NPDC059246]|uniref:MFS transporter n=1 Tax=unclassified Nocardia TaxID=2637762 RepID=UPI0036AEC49C